MNRSDAYISFYKAMHLNEYLEPSACWRNLSSLLEKVNLNYSTVTRTAAPIGRLLLIGDLDSNKSLSLSCSIK